jgi:hypothetical protein
MTFFLSIDIGTASRATHFLFKDPKRRTQGDPLLLTILSIFALPWLTFVFQISASFFFLGRSNGKATDISFLAPGLDGHTLRLGIGENIAIFFLLMHSLFHCRFCSHCTCETPHSLALSVCTLPPILLVQLTSSPFLYSVAHYTRIVIPWLVLPIAEP